MRKIDILKCSSTNRVRLLYSDLRTHKPVYATNEYVIGHFKRTPILLQCLDGDSYAKYCLKTGNGYYCRDEKEVVKVALERWKIVLDPTQISKA